MPVRFTSCPRCSVAKPVLSSLELNCVFSLWKCQKCLNFISIISRLLLNHVNLYLTYDKFQKQVIYYLPSPLCSAITLIFLRKLALKCLYSKMICVKVCCLCQCCAPIKKKSHFSAAGDQRTAKERGYVWLFDLKTAQCFFSIYVWGHLCQYKPNSNKVGILCKMGIKTKYSD